MSPHWQQSPLAKHVLLAADDEGLCSSIQERLQDIGLQVTIVDHADAALSALQAEAHDLLIVDSSLPDSQANQLVVQLEAGGHDTPFIILAGLGDKHIEAGRMKLGAWDYLAKDESLLERLPKSISRVLESLNSEYRLRHAQERQQENQERLNLAITTARLGLWDINLEEGQVIVNHFWEELVGVPCDQPIPLARMEVHIHEEDRGRVVENWKAFVSGRRETFSEQYQVADREGRLHWICDNGSLITPKPTGQRRAIRTQRDRTEAHRAEEQRAALEKQLRHAQKLETIGTLAGGIAHDFNNILAAIYGFAELAIRRTSKGDDTCLNRDLSNIVRSVKRVKSLVQQILLFSRQEEVQHQPLKLNRLIAEALDFLRQSIPTTVEITCDLPDEDIWILAEPTQIQQVVMNLAANAYQAMPEHVGHLRISLSLAQLDATEQSERMPPGAYAALEIEDDGKGMPPETLERIFEPFFTTKSAGEGTGLGLSVVHGILLSHQGDIQVESTVGKGTRFVLYFPLCHDAAEADEEAVMDAVSSGRGHVLLVDDEVDIRAFVSEAMREMGYRVKAFGDPIKALGHFLDNPDDFDLVFSDQTMPGMTGLGLAEAVREKQPDTPIILMTGYADALRPEQLRRAQIQRVLMKPFGMRELGEALAQLSDATLAR